jgi:hypothetical protein
MNTAVKIKPSYDWWNRACQAAAAGQPLPPRTETPEPGFYRTQDGKNGPMLPVAIWDGGGELIALVGFDGATREPDPFEVWRWCAKYPVEEQSYRDAFAAGAWPDTAWADEAPAGIGDNSQAEIPAYDRLVLDINVRVADATVVLNDHPGDLKSKDEADALEATAAWLRQLAGDAENMRVAEKAPHLKASREIDARFRALAGRIEPVLDALTKKVNAWMKAEQARIDAEIAEKARIAREEFEAAKAEAERLAREEAARAAAENGETGQAALADPAPVLVAAPVLPEPVRVQVGGNGTRRRSIREPRIIAVITDYDAALAHFKNHEDIRNLVQALATKAVAAGGTVPGATAAKQE